MEFKAGGIYIIFESGTKLAGQVLHYKCGEWGPDLFQVPEPTTGKKVLSHGTFQPIWDLLQRTAHNSKVGWHLLEVTREQELMWDSISDPSLRSVYNC